MWFYAFCPQWASAVSASSAWACLAGNSVWPHSSKSAVPPPSFPCHLSTCRKSENSKEGRAIHLLSLNAHLRWCSFVKPSKAVEWQENCIHLCLKIRIYNWKIGKKSRRPAWLFCYLLPLQCVHFGQDVFINLSSPCSFLMVKNHKLSSQLQKIHCTLYKLPQFTPPQPSLLLVSYLWCHLFFWNS